MSNAESGRQGEELAAAFLVRQGYRIVERNFRCKVGEIDIVAVEGRVVCFVEVKARAGAGFGDPIDAVDRGKQRRLIRAARLYATQKRLAGIGLRYDIVSVRLDATPPAVQLFRAAFDEGSGFGARGRRW
ncbi:MAG: YraN family protein [Planctomycetes bacterium]|nr:YraN family protein [Planctomycetota bacterium]